MLIMYVFLYMDINTLLSLFLSLLIGTPGLILLGCISSALTIGVRRAGIVIAIIIEQTRANKMAPTIISGKKNGKRIPVPVTSTVITTNTVNILTFKDIFSPN